MPAWGLPVHGLCPRAIRVSGSGLAHGSVAEDGVTGLQQGLGSSLFLVFLLPTLAHARWVLNQDLPFTRSIQRE